MIIRYNGPVTWTLPELDALARDRAAMLERLLYEVNARQNLTRVPREQFMERHFWESLHPIWALCHSELARNLPSQTNSQPEPDSSQAWNDSFRPSSPIIDIGCGPGFPGLPIKILFPDVPITLLDSHGKTLEFVAKAIEKLGLSGVSIVHGRAEEVAHQPEHREKYALVVCRAVGRFEIAAELMAGFVSVGGCAIPHRTESDESFEIDLDRLGLTLERVEALDHLRYPVLRKSQPCAAAIPRKWNQIQR